MGKRNKQHMKEVSVTDYNQSMEDTKNQNHNVKKEGLGPNTKR